MRDSHVRIVARLAAAQWLFAQDERLCLCINRASRIGWLRLALGVAGRLGDGIFWYALMLALLVWEGGGAVPAVVHLFATGAVCTLLYKLIKAATTRPRPYQRNRSIVRSADPLDQYSFPSGHTLHAVAFSAIAIGYYPGLVWVLAPFTALVALSRVVLGLHYPSDVLAGAMLGAAIATISFLI